jgi:hypothetical protein
MRAVLALLRDRDLGEDALRGKVVEQLLAARDPCEMSTQPRHDPKTALGDVTPQLGPKRPGARRPNDMARRPRVTGPIVGVRRQRLPFPG